MHVRNAVPIDTPRRLIDQALNDVAAGSLARAQARADSASRLAREFLSLPANATANRFGQAADFHTVLGMALAINGQAVEAVRAGEQAIAMNPSSRDASEGPRSVDGLIAIHLILGQREAAIRLIIEQAHAPVTISSPLTISRASLRLEPLFDGVRDDPRIQALLNNDAAWVVR